ncbi:Lmo0654 family protein [Listeria costaricensis]|uniref:Lmo0654 family protein n=1 Tax=Listeria costaricensis TaxID=2026604 RepID=UPI000C08BAD1|nr:Lmo0654 family protein [Listeria costaricensis]
MANDRQDLEERLIELRREYQEVLAESYEFEDPQLQNGPINTAEVRLDAIRKEIKDVEKRLKKFEEVE